MPAPIRHHRALGEPVAIEALPTERGRLSGAPIVEKAVATSERPSAVDVEESLVLWHPSHVVAIWAASASEVMLQGLVALSLILLVAADAVGGR